MVTAHGLGIYVSGSCNSIIPLMYSCFYPAGKVTIGSLYLLLLFACVSETWASGGTHLPPRHQTPICESDSMVISYHPATPATKFADIYGDNDIAITSFEARCSRLKAAYVWVHEESSGLIAAQISRESPYGTVVATGSLGGKSPGKHQIEFATDVYLEKGQVYYLKLFKGEPATVAGSLAKAAENLDQIEGYNTYGPLAYDLAHELVFDRWEGDPPANEMLDERKKTPKAYENAVNDALNSHTDLLGEEVLRLPEGPTYENIAGYLTPLKLIGTAVTESGVYYLPFGRPLNNAGFGPVALHVGDGSQVISQVATGSKVTFFVGTEGRERFGFAEARLAQESLEDGYQPILVNNYTDYSGVTYVQESFSDYTFATTELVSFVKLTIQKRNAEVNAVKVRLHFSDRNLTLNGNVLKVGNEVRAMLTEGGKLTGGNTVVYDVDLRHGDQEIYLARLLNPAQCVPFDPTSSYYNVEKAELKGFWDGELAKGAVFEVPEERVNNAQKGLLIQNLFMGYLYSIGNSYQTWYQPEGNDAARILGEYGFLERQKAMHEVLLSVPFRRYRTWEMGELLSHSAQYYHLSKDTAFIRRHEQKFIGFMEDFQAQMEASANGVLSAEAFSGDIPEKLVYLHHQAVAWRGMRDMAAILLSLSQSAVGSRFVTLADSLRNRLLRAVNESKTLLSDGSIFLPTELFTKAKPAPYAMITASKYGSYWNLCFPYVAASGFLDRELVSGYYQYLKNCGAFFLGMVRFNYYPVAIGDYRKDGLPGYKTTGVDNVYGLNISRVIAMMDDPDRLVLSLYAKLAHGMTRNTFISGEGDTVGPYPGEYYRTSYLSPSSFNNSWFLLMLRLMLVYETEGEMGAPVELHLAHSTPRGWLAQGKHIKVEKAPTLFGELDYLITSDIDNGKINVAVTMPSQVDVAERVFIRLRTPGKRRIEKVELNGKVHRAFDADQETIDLTGKRGTLQLTAFYK